MIRHLAYADSVQGGALLVSQDLPPVLLIEDFLDGAGGRRRSAELREYRRPRGGRRYVADSAEAMRTLKGMLGIPSRPTTDPVDVWLHRN